jgi:Kef-type K+ transport system membrane component KefB
MCGINFYFMMFCYGLVTTLSEWKQIRATAFQKIAYSFTFPLFLFTYVPITVAALLQKVSWQPITHTVSKTLEEIV